MVDDFGFSFQPTVDESVMDDLITMRYKHNNENVVFLGSPGVRRNPLSVALGIRAFMSDIQVYYTSVLKLV
jgi:DNA replication protein DnaC